MTPLITVIVTAYNREEFLNRALESLISQDAPPEEFEVIVVKNFDNQEVDRTIGRMGGRSIYDNSAHPYAFSEEAVKSAKGDVICFLDDDDLFLPRKISSVIDAFTRNPEVDYYHNSMDYINVNGDAMKPPYSFSFSVLKKHSRETVLSHEEAGKRIHELIANKWDYNKSCISVRRKLLIDHLELARETVSAYDSFIFYLAALCGRSIMATPEILTHYRLNRKSVTVSSRYKFSLRQIKTFSALHDFAEAAGEKEIASVLTRQIFFFDLISGINNPDRSRRGVVAAGLSFIRHSKGYSLMANMFPVVLAAVYMFSPGLSREIFTKLVMARL
jgi:glycosyltransferase involved in cell wall biosynthesis